jgi:hypothetical protein
MAVAVGLGAAREAGAHCTPATLCPGAGDCTIGTLSTPNSRIDDGCTLDFGTRKVTLNGTLDIDGNAVTIRAREFIISSTGLIDGSPQGGFITILTTGGNIVVQGTGAKGIDVVGQDQGGIIVLDAPTGDVTVEGRLKANNGNNSTDASGGSIDLRAGGNLLIGGNADVNASGGRNADGGTLDFFAIGGITINRDVKAEGGEGGDVNLQAGEGILLNGRIIADSIGGGGGGGFIDILAGKAITLGGSIRSVGSTSSDNFGGDGGFVAIGSDLGDVIVRAEITAQSGGPDGGGGEIEVSAGRSVKLQAGRLKVSGEGFESFAGSIFLDGDIDITIGAPIDASGGSEGGEIELASGRNVEIANLLDVRGRQLATFSGSILIDAGILEQGGVTLKAGATQSTAGRILANGAGCLSGQICSIAGTVDISGCNVTVEGTGSGAVAGLIDASAPGDEGAGGGIVVVARRQLTAVGGATLTASGNGAQGAIEIVHPASKAVALGGSVIMPQPAFTACTEANCPANNCPPGDEACRACRPLCFDFCDCGDGMRDEFERCDRPDNGTCNTGAGEVCGVTGTFRECICINTCGNNQLDVGEECDGAGGSTCAALGFFDPDPPTAVSCATCAFNTSVCEVGSCGDNFLAPRNELNEKNLPGLFEVCDGTDVGEETCVSLGFTRGDLKCKTDCSGFDISECEVGICGDNVLDAGEECDSGNANSNAPNAPCRPGCLLPRCGDGITDTSLNEQCDDANKSNNDRCLIGCLAATCGDGFVCSAPGCTSGPNDGREQCDGAATCCLSTCGRRACPDGLACDNLGNNGCCHPGDCNDGNVCTTDSTCNLTMGCTFTPIIDCCTGPGAICDDGNACTTNDKCTGLACGGTQITCVSPDPCQEATPCDPVDGCQFRDIPGCCTENADCGADGDACTTELCDTATHECVTEQIQCTTTDECLAVTGCDPQAGCQTARVNGLVGLDCLMARELLSLTTGVPAKEPELGKKLVKQLGKFLKKATKKIEKGRQFAADPKKAAKAPKQLTGADKLLGKFLAKLGSADPAAAAPLVELAQFIRDQLAGAL